MIEFDNRMEELIAGAKAVVAMGGYNTYCEILSFDKPALIVPRVAPRQEQLIRARRAAELGLIEMFLPEEAEDALKFAAALKALPQRDPPSKSNPDLTLLGLGHISEIVETWLDQRSTATFRWSRVSQHAARRQSPLGVRVRIAAKKVMAGRTGLR